MNKIKDGQIKTDLFNIRDEIIDCVDDINDYWTELVDGHDWSGSVVKRLENALALMESLRENLNIEDRDYEGE